MDDTGAIGSAFIAAAGLGAIIGLERQVSSRGEDPAEIDTYAGVRTFALYGVWGAGAGFFGDRFGSTAFLVAALAFGGLLAASYVSVALRLGDWGTTTGSAAFVTFIIGALAWAEQFVAALAPAVGVAILLRGNGFLHELLKSLLEEDIRAALQFAALPPSTCRSYPTRPGAIRRHQLPQDLAHGDLRLRDRAGRYISLRILGSPGPTSQGCLAGWFLQPRSPSDSAGCPKPPWPPSPGLCRPE